MEKEYNTYNEFDDLIIRYLNGEISDDEITLLTQWLNKSEENKKKFLEIKIAWKASAQVQNAEPELVYGALNHLNERMQTNVRNKSILGQYSLNRIVRIAAVLLLTVTISSLVTYIIFSNRSKGIVTVSESLIYIYAPMGSKAMTLLPDGTKVWLNAGSKLSYLSGYNTKSRIVNLEGEGFFDVKTNPQKPFIVKAKGLDIKAYGTSFNVKAYSEEKEVVTTLVRGKVFIEGKDKLNKEFVIRMKPQQSVTYLINNQEDEIKQTDEVNGDNNKNVVNTEPGAIGDQQLPVITTEAVKTELYTSWKDDRWVINGEEIGKLAASLERKYNIKIFFQSEELKNYRFTGIFQNETVEQVFEVLKMTAPLKYEIGPGVVTLSIDESLTKKFSKYFK